MRVNRSNSLHRREFLGAMVATGAIGLGSLVPFRLNAMQDEGMGGKMNAPGFEDWLSKIKGKHKQVFDAPHNLGGMPLVWSRVYLLTNQQVGVKEGDVQAVVVLRHDAIPLAMDSALWKKYNFSKLFDVRNPETKKPITQNVFWQPKSGTFPLAEIPLPGTSIDDHLKSGTLIGVCDMAITVFSGKVAEKMKLKPEDVKKEWEAAVLPGIQIVPSGVLAVNRAQEHGCAYCFAG